MHSIISTMNEKEGRTLILTENNGAFLLGQASSKEDSRK